MSKKIGPLNEEVIKGQVRELVRSSVEETLNELLETGAKKLTQAALPVTSAAKPARATAAAIMTEIRAVPR